MLPFEKLPYIFFQPLIEIKVLVTAVFLQHNGHIDLTVLIALQRIPKQLGRRRQTFYLLLALTKEYGANGYQQFQDHAVHDVMSLHIKIGVIRNQP